MSWTLFILLWFTSGTICTIVRICAFYCNKKAKEQCTSRTEATVIDIVISESTESPTSKRSESGSSSSLKKLN